jgi:quercetin dioxygenase-like cupin family protein
MPKGTESRLSHDKEVVMPFYKISEMEGKRSKISTAVGKSVAGELMKVSVITYQEGEGARPHFHPNEEQFQLVLEGKMKVVLGDEEQICEPGSHLIHIPRNVRHGVCAMGGPVVFFTAKSPVGTGDMSQDVVRAKDADEGWKRLSSE